MVSRKDFPVLLVDDELDDETAEGRFSRSILEALVENGFKVLDALSARDALMLFSSRPETCCIILDWDLREQESGRFAKPGSLLREIREKNRRVPVFLMTDKLAIADAPLDVMSDINGYIWKLEDTPDFIAGRVEEAALNYISKTMPPFFKELVRYVEEYKYTWHTPGHMGGVAFLKTATGREFFDFFGENVLRSDLSVSVPELGSLLEHSGPVGEAEAGAARIFGSDYTYFVTNGTSTANKIVWHGIVTEGDTVLVDRNCHKSIMHAIIMTGAVPVYLIPTRNAYGIIGPIHLDEFSAASIRAKIKENTLAKGPGPPRLAVVTNSTYDGLCYNARMITRELGGTVPFVHFDEAWYGYARFHELYRDRFGMSPELNLEGISVLATQSTHKVLAAFSQGSMIHVKDPSGALPGERFNEAFMMHTSTSPQYGIIGSLDVGAKMMEGESGRNLIGEAIDEAVVFRNKMRQISTEITGADESGWWFGVWQPPSDEQCPLGTTDERQWLLDPVADWHGFTGLAEEYILLDPIKVTVLTPGIKDKGGLDDWGIPASIVSMFLRKRGIVVEKTGHYSFLVLFTIGITKGKSGTLLSELFEFKRLYDRNATLEEVFGELVRDCPDVYGGLGLRDLADALHGYLKGEDITNVIADVYDVVPEPAILPAEAYRRLIRGGVEEVAVSELEGRTCAVMVVPYPPGIPVMMPGEKFGPSTRKTIDFLAHCEDFDNSYPGFENEVHGIIIEDERNRKAYYVYCLID